MFEAVGNVYRLPSTLDAPLEVELLEICGETSISKEVLCNDLLGLTQCHQ
jgi:hypothetical protein